MPTLMLICTEAFYVGLWTLWEEDFPVVCMALHSCSLYMRSFFQTIYWIWVRSSGPNEPNSTTPYLHSVHIIILSASSLGEVDAFLSYSSMIISYFYIRCWPFPWKCIHEKASAFQNLIYSALTKTCATAAFLSFLLLHLHDAMGVSFTHTHPYKTFCESKAQVEPHYPQLQRPWIWLSANSETPPERTHLDPSNLTRTVLWSGPEGFYKAWRGHTWLPMASVGLRMSIHHLVIISNHLVEKA